MYVKQDQVFPNVTLTLPGRLVKLSVPAQWNSCNIIVSTLSYLSPRTQGCGHLLNFSSTGEQRGAKDTRDEGTPSSSATNFFTKEEDSESDFTIRISPHKHHPHTPPPRPRPPHTTTHTFYQPHSAEKKIIITSWPPTNLLSLGPSMSSPLSDSTDPWWPHVSSAPGLRLFFMYLDICEPCRGTLVLFYKDKVIKCNSIGRNRPKLLHLASYTRSFC